MNLYHGSNVSVKIPSLDYSNKFRDFGAGFYLTADLEQASVWSKKKTDKINKGEPTVSIFELNEDNISKLNVKKFDMANEEWFDYVLNNRTNDLYNDNYDIVIGPIANDGTYEVINLYIRGILTKKQAITELKTFKLKNQYVFKTNSAISKLIYKGVYKL